jgi:hypothetical protein
VWIVILIALLQGSCAHWQGFCTYKNDDAYHAFGPGVVAARSWLQLWLQLWFLHHRDCHHYSWQRSGYDCSYLVVSHSTQISLKLNMTLQELQTCHHRLPLRSQILCPERLQQIKHVTHARNDLQHNFFNSRLPHIVLGTLR